MKKLDKLGCVVFAGCLLPKECEKLNNETSNNIHCLPMDVTNLIQIKSVYKIIENYCKNNNTHLWGIVNNAGIAIYSPFELLTHQQFHKVLCVFSHLLTYFIFIHFF